MRLEKYINKYFYPAYVIANLCPVYLLGGAICDLIDGKTPKDLYFVVIGKENLDWVMQVFKVFNIKYTHNRLGGFKIEYNGTSIDLWLKDDLFSSIEYNVDGSFFDLKNNTLLSLTFDDFLKNGLKLVNSENNINNKRVKKLIKFQKEFMNII